MGKAVSVEHDGQRDRPPNSEVERLLSDNRQAREVLGWAPQATLDEGLEQTIEWLGRHLRPLPPGHVPGVSRPAIPLFDLRIDRRGPRRGRGGPAQRAALRAGEQVEAFEREFAEHLGVRHAIAVTNCTAALHLAYLAAGVGPGDEVVVPSITFAATAAAALYCGATPVFADSIGPHDIGIDPDRRRAAAHRRARRRSAPSTSPATRPRSTTCGASATRAGSR